MTMRSETANGQPRIVADGPTFTILAGQLASDEFDPDIVTPTRGGICVFDSAGRPAGEVISIQAAYPAVPAAGDWRVVTATVFGATLNTAVAVTVQAFFGRRVRLVSSVPVTTTRVFVSRILIS